MKKYISFITLSLLLAACSNTNAPEAAEYGYINLNIGTNPEISVAETRAETVYPEADDSYLITIKSGAITHLDKKTYGLIKSTPLRFSEGAYAVTAENCISDEAETVNDRWGKARYYGSQDVNVAISETANVNVLCKMQNAKVNVQYDETFKNLFGADPANPYSVSIYRYGKQERLLKFDKDATFDTQSAYFNILESASNKLIYTIKGTYNGKSVEKEGEINTLAAQKWIKLTIKATQTGKIELGVEVDSTVNEENSDFDVNPYA